MNGYEGWNETEASEKGKNAELLEAFIKVAPYLNDLLNDDITIGVYDTEKLLRNVPAQTFSLQVKSGDPLQEGDVITNAIRKNTKQAMMVPKELFGFPLVARAIPLHDHTGKVIGGVGIGSSMERANELYEIAANLSSVVEQVSATTHEMAVQIGNLNEQMKAISEQANDVSQSTTEIEQITLAVKKIADQSNILGLNASIEAARVGDAGRGFAVVANEVRNMATDSRTNADKIKQTTDSIRDLITLLQNSIELINQTMESQAAATEEISATMVEVSDNTQKLAGLAQEVFEIK
ncbi:MULTISPECIES: methyl-accepting chemotaxis protein [Brevibacillus]|uniref:methyl-accepting chemotaxis protein n=1 Tax=Brevibacillus TaxID=55080 RepID=UPI000B38BE39|nr:methyl-accepting chemotaxis protein [Brevibacillus brevis]MBH0330498.1 chemotaxis protein [Brevibacillus brevis]OUQ88218.1 chemotaxis protein [Brevibacillus brevis]